jgi:HEPN domain-containing protein
METAVAMLQTKRYLYVGFMCHQCIEKIFKAAYEHQKNSTPPFVHDLPLIANKAGIFEMMDDEQIAFIEQLSPLNIRTRYPDYKRTLAKELTKTACENLIAKTQKLQQWTKEKILLIK